MVAPCAGLKISAADRQNDIQVEPTGLYPLRTTDELLLELVWAKVLELLVNLRVLLLLFELLLLLKLIAVLLLLLFELLLLLKLILVLLELLDENISWIVNREKS